MASPPGDRGGGNDTQDEAGCRDLPGGQGVSRMRVEDRQLCRIQELPEIGDVRVQRVRHPGPCREVPHRAPSRLLHGVRDERRCGGECEQRQLLEPQPSHRRDTAALSGGCSAGGRRHREALERPVVQEQQHEGQGHEHGLAQETQGEESCHQQVTGNRGRPSDVAQVRSEREREEQAAQHVFPFGNPGHRLHVQRMNGEQGRHESTRPERASSLQQHQEEDDGGGGVEENARQVMSARVRHTIHLDVSHV